MMTIPVAAQRIQRQVTELEQTLNLAMAQAAALTETCATARTLPGVAATAGQPVMLRMASLTQHLVQGSGDIARVHGDLLALGRDHEVMAPDTGGDCPPNPLTTGRAVA